MEKHLHHKFVAYDELNGDQFKFGTEVIVDECETEDEALIKAKKICKRKNYWLQKVWECSTCKDAQNAQTLQMAQLKMLKGMMGSK